MDKELRNKISENKILTCHERAKIISDLESYEDLRTKIDKAISEIEDEIKFWNKTVCTKTVVVEARKEKANLYKHALEILKRNLEE